MPEALGGLALFLVRMWFLSENIKALTARPLRTLVSDWVPNRYAAWGRGVRFGRILQSLPALTFITISMLRANLLTTERAFALLIGGNVSAGLFVLFESLDIRLAAQCILGGQRVDAERKSYQVPERRSLAVWGRLDVFWPRFGQTDRYVIH